MLFLIVIITIANACTIGHHVTLNFDDINITNAFITLPRPYHGYVFKRSQPNDGFPDDDIPAGNTTQIGGAWTNAAYSKPNIILTTRESLSIQKSDNSTFKIRHIAMASIFIANMQVFINTYRLGKLHSSMNVTLPLGTPSVFKIYKCNIDQVLIGCVNGSFDTCAHIAYDNVAVR